MPSLLPQQIPPQTAEFGTVMSSDGKVMGKVIIDVNWWLFLLNISKQVLSASAGPIPVTTTVASFILSDDDIVPPNPNAATVVDWLGP